MPKYRIEQISYFALKCLGLNVIDGKINIVLILFTKCILLTLSGLTLLEVIVGIKNYANGTLNGIEVIMATTALQVTLLKYSQLVKNKDKFTNLFKLLKNKLLVDSSELDIVEEKRAMPLIKLLFNFSIGSVLISFIKSNVISMDLEKSVPLYHIMEPENRTEHPYIFYGIFTTQLIGSFQVTMINISTLCIFAHVNNFVCIQLKLLGVCLDNLTSKQCNEMSEKVKEEQFHQYIKFHFHILRIVEELQAVFSTTIFWEFLSSQFLSCLLLTLTTKNFRNGDYLMALTDFLLIPALLLTSFTYFYLGTKLTQAGLEVRIAIYSTQWYNQSKAFNQMLSIMLERLKKPLVMCAAHVIPVSLNSFLKALEAGYSYFNFLDAMYRRGNS